MKGGGEAKFWVRPVELDRSAGFDARVLRQLAQVVADRAAEIEVAWHDHFRD